MVNVKSNSPMKVVSAEEAVAMFPNGTTVMVGRFMGVGKPERLLDEPVQQRKSELSIISNDAAGPGKGGAHLTHAVHLDPRVESWPIEAASPRCRRSTSTYLRNPSFTSCDDPVSAQGAKSGTNFTRSSEPASWIA